MLIPPLDSKVLIKEEQENLVVVKDEQEDLIAKEKKLLEIKEQENLVVVKDEQEDLIAKEKKLLEIKEQEDLIAKEKKLLKIKEQEDLIAKEEKLLEIKKLKKLVAEKEKQEDLLISKERYLQSLKQDKLNALKRNVSEIMADVKELKQAQKRVENKRSPYKSKVNTNNIWVRNIKDISPKIAPQFLKVWHFLYSKYREKDFRVIEKCFYDHYGFNFSWFDNSNLVIVFSGGHLSFRTNSEEIFKFGDIIFMFRMDPDLEKFTPSERKELFELVKENISLMESETTFRVLTETLLDRLLIFWHEQEYKYVETDIWKIKKLFFERFGFNLYWLEEDTIITFSEEKINFTRSYQNLINDFLFVINKVEPSITEDIKEKEKNKNEKKDEETDDVIVEPSITEDIKEKENKKNQKKDEETDDDTDIKD